MHNVNMCIVVMIPYLDTNKLLPIIDNCSVTYPSNQSFLFHFLSQCPLKLKYYYLSYHLFFSKLFNCLCLDQYVWMSHNQQIV